MAQENSGLVWSHEPPVGDRQVVWTIKRTPQGKGGGLGVILSHRLIGTHTHFFGGRTRPCTGSNCSICEKGQQPRWKGYLAITDKSLQSRVILEIPARACDLVDKWFCDHRTLRGSMIGTKRVNDKANGRVTAQLFTSLINKESLPEAPNVQKILLRMWEVQEIQATMPTVGELRVLKPTGTDDAIVD